MLYPCKRETCTGSGPDDDKCWSRSSFHEGKRSEVNSECKADALLCAVGSSGPLCGSCTPGFIYRANVKSCGPCDEAQATTLYGVIAGLVLVALAGAVAAGLIPSPSPSLSHICRSIDSGSLKVCWATYQIILSTSWTLDIRFRIRSPCFDITIVT